MSIPFLSVRRGKNKIWGFKCNCKTIIPLGTYLPLSRYPGFSGAVPVFETKLKVIVKFIKL